ncbi:chromosome partitioning protein ParB, partial [Acinetobacter baumannii]
MNKPSVDLSGLDGLSFGDLMTSEPAAAAAPAASGTPLEMDVAIIDEDPGQPRTEQNPGFAPEQIAEIGASIKARGVKTPISVRENPDKPGHYLI